MSEFAMSIILKLAPEVFFRFNMTLMSEQEVFPSGITDQIYSRTGAEALYLVELKRGVAKRRDVVQLLHYVPDVESRYGKKVIPYLVANVVPEDIRLLLDRLAMHFLEIPAHRFREVAEKYSIDLPNSVAQDEIVIRSDCPQSRIRCLIAELENSGEMFVARFGRNLRRELLDSQFAGLSSKMVANLSKWCAPKRKGDRELWVMPRAHEISRLLFGRILSRMRHDSYDG